MTAQNEADRRSEAKRRRKRSAINKHLHRAHKALFRGSPGEWELSISGKTTLERITFHYELHQHGNVDHTHEDLEDLEEMERMNNGGENK